MENKPVLRVQKVRLAGKKTKDRRQVRGGKISNN